MSDYTKAAMIVGEAAATRAYRDKLLRDIAAWAEANPPKAYGDRNDTLTSEQVETLLTSREAFDEEWWEVERHCYDYVDWDSVREECLREFRALLADAYGLPEDFKWRDLPHEVDEALMESVWVDTSDLLDTCLRHASRTVNIVAIPSDPNAPGDDCDEPGAIHLPHGNLSDEENEARQRYLAETFGIDGWACESMYEHERLKVLGKLDLREVYEKGTPTNITIDPQDSLIFHTSWNGSGCMGSPVASKTVTLPATFEVDENRRWGVQSVYGFVGEVWRHTLNANGFAD